MVLVYVEHKDGKFKKNILEAVTYGKKTADMLSTECAALVIGNADTSALGTYGADKVYTLNADGLGDFDSQSYSSAIANTASQIGAKVVLMSDTASAKTLLGRVAVKLDAACISAASSLPKVEGDSIVVTSGTFSGKAIAHYSLSGDTKVMSINGNTIKPEELGAAGATEAISVAVDAPGVKVIGQDTLSSERAPLPEAELVVSAGRGMKGPENWGIIEELADAIGATTACSRPVADTGWRPHHEHVGQTGVAIRPNLYFAIGISGAIQHLAGVNSSKVIVVINKDPEAPFFKAADYGVCADLFDVVPKLTAALKKG